MTVALMVAACSDGTTGSGGTTTVRSPTSSDVASGSTSTPGATPASGWPIFHADDHHTGLVHGAGAIDSTRGPAVKAIYKICAGDRRTTARRRHHGPQVSGWPAHLVVELVVLVTARRSGHGHLMGRMDYRASPDWAELLSYSPIALEEMQLRAIGFPHDVAKPYLDQLAAVKVAGIVGPRGDAYTLHQGITVEQAQDYHSTQIATLAKAEVDLVEARPLRVRARCSSCTRSTGVVTW